MTKKVDQQSDAIAAILQKSEAVRDLIKGGAHVRSLGRKYLPQFPMERPEDYEARLKSSWLFNGVSKAIGDMSGRVFEKPVVLQNQEGELFEWCQNIDMEGRDLSNFANDVFEKAIEVGITFLLVDAPGRDGPLTRQQVQAANIRPHMAHIDPETVLGWRWTVESNAPTLSHFRFMEMVDDPENGAFDDKKIEQVRAYFLEEGRAVVRLYRKQDGEKEFEQFGPDIATDLTYIPVVPVYTGRTGFFEAETTLADMAELNLAHYRCLSDKANCLHLAQSPILLFRGVDLEDSATAGAGYAFQSNAEFAQISWAEISGSGIAEGEKQLLGLEKQMQWMGLQLMTQRVGHVTATESNIEEGKTVSRLKMWADNLKDSLEIALQMMAEMGGLGDVDVTVDVNKDFGFMSADTLQAVRDMYVAGVISREAYAIEAQRRGVLREEYDAEADEALLEGDDMQAVA